jgi:hypothetical protein
VTGASRKLTENLNLPAHLHQYMGYDIPMNLRRVAEPDFITDAEERFEGFENLMPFKVHPARRRPAQRIAH